MMGAFPSPAFSEHRCRILSDLHLKEDGEESVHAFFRIIQSAHQEGVPIVCGGDFFHLFLGWPGTQTPLQRRIYEFLGDLREEGLRFYWVEGNRDYRPKLWEPVATVTPHALYWVLGDLRMGMIHGDRLNLHDLPTQLWRLVSKNALARSLPFLLPKNRFRRWSLALERHIHEQNLNKYGLIPWNHIRKRLTAWAQRSNLHTALVGHFHIWALARLKSKRSGPIDCWFVPSWETQPNYLELDKTGKCTLYDEKGHPIPEVPVDLSMDTPHRPS